MSAQGTDRGHLTTVEIGPEPRRRTGFVVPSRQGSSTTPGPPKASKQCWSQSCDYDHQNGRALILKGVWLGIWNKLDKSLFGLPFDDLMEECARKGDFDGTASDEPSEYGPPRPRTLVKAKTPPSRVVECVSCQNEGVKHGPLELTRLDVKEGPAKNRFVWAYRCRMDNREAFAIVTSVPGNGQYHFYRRVGGHLTDHPITSLGLNDLLPDDAEKDVHIASTESERPFQPFSRTSRASNPTDDTATVLPQRVFQDRAVNSASTPLSSTDQPRDEPAKSHKRKLGDLSSRNDDDHRPSAPQRREPTSYVPLKPPAMAGSTAPTTTGPRWSGTVQGTSKTAGDSIRLRHSQNSILLLIEHKDLEDPVRLKVGMQTDVSAIFHRIGRMLTLSLQTSSPLTVTGMMVSAAKKATWLEPDAEVETMWEELLGDLPADGAPLPLKVMVLTT